MEERTEIADLGEFGLIDHLTKNFEIQNVSTVLGVGMMLQSLIILGNRP